MTKLNVVYDGCWDDVDIIMIPDYLVCDIDDIAQQYLNWIPPEDYKDGWSIVNQKKCLQKNAKGFVRWLNINYCKTYKASLIKENVNFCSDYKAIEF